MTNGLNPADGIAVFTDGSCYHKDKTGGWGWVAIDAYDGIQTDSGFASDTTISRMELWAPTTALLSLAIAYRECNLLVFSDSEYVVLGVNDKTRKRNKNKRWWNDLIEAINFHHYVEFHHVRGHNNNLYNEMADKLAGEARKRGTN